MNILRKIIRNQGYEEHYSIPDFTVFGWAECKGEIQENGNLKY